MKFSGWDPNRLSTHALGRAIPDVRASREPQQCRTEERITLNSLAHTRLCRRKSRNNQRQEQSIALAGEWSSGVVTYGVEVGRSKPVAGLPRGAHRDREGEQEA
jgi:hypothetical protein